MLRPPRRRNIWGGGRPLPQILHCVQDDMAELRTGFPNRCRLYLAVTAAWHGGVHSPAFGIGDPAKFLEYLLAVGHPTGDFVQGLRGQ